MVEDGYRGWIAESGMSELREGAGEIRKVAAIYTTRDEEGEKLKKVVVYKLHIGRACAEHRLSPFPA